MNQHIPLITLKQMHSTAASLLCFPGAGDSITSFLSLIDSLKMDFNIFGLQPRGLLVGQDPYDSISQTVDVYIESISKQHLQGKVYLLGHSFGGWIAVHMAQRLKKMNVDLAPLVLLDSSAPETPHEHLSRVDNLLELIETLEMACNSSFAVTAETLLALDDEGQLQLLHQKMVATSLLPRNSQVDSIRGMVRLFLANCHMEFGHEATYGDASVLINAADAKETEQERHENLVRWREYLPALKYKESNGNHITLLGSENAPLLANLLMDIWRP